MTHIPPPARPPSVLTAFGRYVNGSIFTFRCLIPTLTVLVIFLSALAPVYAQCTLTNVGDVCYASSGTTKFIVKNPNGVCLKVSEDPPGGTSCNPGDCSTPPCMCSAEVWLGASKWCGDITPPVNCTTWALNCCRCRVAYNTVVTVYADLCASKRVKVEVVAACN